MFAAAAPVGKAASLTRVHTASALQVLLVDDLPFNLQDASELLSQWGIVPITASNGAEALALARERHFDLILMDISMPVMDGLEATRRIRQLGLEQPQWPRTAIVAYTTGKLVADMAMQLCAGFDEAIHKPCTADRMKACLGRWCVGVDRKLSQF